MTVAILLSGGKGSRMGTDIPKQYITVEGVPILVYCLKTMNKSEYIDKIIRLIWMNSLMLLIY